MTSLSRPAAPLTPACFLLESRMICPSRRLSPPGNLFRVIGPGAILLAGSMGGGEWLVGPAIGVQYGMGLFWIATLAIILRVIFNLESIRYTLYTGEPIISGIMRLEARPSEEAR